MMIPYYNTHKNSAYFHNLCYFIFINTFIISKRCVAIESTIKRRQFPQKTFSTSIDDTHRRINSLNFEKSAIGNQIFSSAKSFGQRIPPKVDSGYFRRKKKKKIRQSMLLLLRKVKQVDVNAFTFRRRNICLWLQNQRQHQPQI